MIGLIAGQRPTAWEQGYRAGNTGSGFCTLDCFASSREYLDWYEGYKAGRQQAESDVVARMGVGREYARNYLNLRRAG